jgi:hypothetical protein
MAKTMIEHDDIREWAEARAGEPMLEDIPDVDREQVLLAITFGQHAINADHNEGPDPITGWSLVTWDEWFAAFDQQNLALKVNDELPGQLDRAFEFVSRDGEGLTTEAARQPAPGTVARPEPSDEGFGPLRDNPDRRDEE